jgi:hypothetical protein
VNLIENADALVEGDEICAAAEEHVLTIVDDFVDAWMQIGTRAAAQVATTLDQMHAQSGCCKSAGRAHAGNAAADDGDGTSFGLACGYQVI